MPHLPTQARIKSVLSYEPSTGIFWWLDTEERKREFRKGKPAGCRTPFGYIRIGLDGHHHAAAHLAWIYFYGEPAGCEIDHKNGDPSDNSISNLRKATSSQQKQNRKVQTNNKSGLKGAYYHACRKGKKWRSQIKVDQKLIFLGYFDTAEEAHAAHTRAAKEYFGEFYREPTIP